MLSKRVLHLNRFPKEFRDFSDIFVLITIKDCLYNVTKVHDSIHCTQPGQEELGTNYDQTRSSIIGRSEILKIHVNVLNSK